jgi:hypothetical protein
MGQCIEAENGKEALEVLTDNRVIVIVGMV